MDEFIKFLKNNIIIAVLSNEISNINEKITILRANINDVNEVWEFHNLIGYTILLNTHNYIVLLIISLLL